MPENLTRAIDDLTVEVRQLKAQVEGEREDRRAERVRDRRHFVTIIASVVVGALLATLVGFLWNRSAIHANNAKFCALLSSTSESDRSVSDPPNTAGRRQAEAAGRLYGDFGCDG